MKKLIIRGMEVRHFSKKVVEWYDFHKRNLPWRHTRDPYKIWLSEIILQQTRVQQGLPYYEKFVREFPNVRALATAPAEKVLRLWQGLGYYTRARNLHACAKVVVKKYKGIFPGSYEELKQLPGIGDYTAAAIASIAFDEARAVVDGNVFRVLARVFGIDTPVNSTEGMKKFAEFANKLIDHTHPGRYNQAIMEFGALQCTPKNPRCDECILQTGCVAYHMQLQAVLPVKLDRKKNRRRYFYYFVLKKGVSLAMRKRNGKDIWTGLYDFYLVEKKRPTKPETIIHSDAFLNRVDKEALDVSHSVNYKHILSHQTIISKFSVMQLKRLPELKESTLRLYSMQKIKELPKPVLISRFLSDLRLL